MEHALLNKLWVIDGLNDYIFRFQPFKRAATSDTEKNDRSAMGDRRMTSAGCNWRACLKRSGVLTRSWKCLSGRRELNPWHDNNSSGERNPITCPVNTLPGKIRVQNEHLWADFHSQFPKTHMLRLPRAPLQQAVCCWLKPPTVASHRFEAGARIHALSSLFVSLRTVFSRLAHILPPPPFFSVCRFCSRLKMDENFI